MSSAPWSSSSDQSDHWTVLIIGLKMHSNNDFASVTTDGGAKGLQISGKSWDCLVKRHLARVLIFRFFLENIF